MIGVCLVICTSVLLLPFLERCVRRTSGHLAHARVLKCIQCSQNHETSLRICLCPSRGLRCNPQRPNPPKPSIGACSQAFARAKEREKVREQAATALMSGAENGGGEDDMGRALAAGGRGGGGAAVATVLGHGPQTPMRQVSDGGVVCSLDGPIH